jgi:hypothetical protein
LLCIFDSKKSNKINFTGHGALKKCIRTTDFRGFRLF